MESGTTFYLIDNYQLLTGLTVIFGSHYQGKYPSPVKNDGGLYPLYADSLFWWWTLDLSWGSTHSWSTSTWSSWTRLSFLPFEGMNVTWSDGHGNWVSLRGFMGEWVLRNHIHFYFAYWPQE